MQIVPLVLASWRLIAVNARSLNAKSALAQAKASSSILIGINSNYLMAHPWGFSFCVAMMKHMADAFLGLLAPCNEPLTRVTVFFLCVFLPGIMSDHQFGNQFMCSVVASHVSHLPTTNLSFVWIAPPAGTGCVNFMYVYTPSHEQIISLEIMKRSNLLTLSG